MEDNIPTAAGLSSFNLLDEENFFGRLDIRPGMVMLDLACGVGNYSIAASPHVGAQGIIHAVDLWEEGIETLNVRTELGQIDNIRTRIADAAGPLPLQDNCTDLCLMATVVHILVTEGKLARTMAELERVLKPGGRVAVVEFKKIDVPPGPPVSRRLSPEKLAAEFSRYGFSCRETGAIGPYNYLSLFSRGRLTDD